MNYISLWERLFLSYIIILGYIALCTFRKTIPDQIIYWSYSLGAGASLDILAISCDSFDESTNSDIGRQQGSKNHLNSLVRVRKLCMDYKVAFKVNTVVNTYNWKEDMSQQILELNPVRWKVCLFLCY